MVKSLNKIQDKKYRINKRVLDLLESKLFYKDFGIKRKRELYDLYVKHKESGIEVIERFEQEDFEEHWFSYKVSLSSLFASGNYKKADKLVRQNLIEKERMKYKITDSFIKGLEKFQLTKRELFKELGLYRHHYFILEFAKVFSNQDLYLVSNFDFRGRFFPVGRGLHRASGLYKYLLYDKSDEYVYTEESLNNLKSFISLVCFNYKKGFSVEDLIKRFNSDFMNISVESLKKDLEDIVNLKSSNNFCKEILESSEPFLLTVCFLDYLNNLKDKKYVSKLSLDYDQCSSGPMIYGLLSKDRKMCELTNVFEKKKSKNDLYYDFLENFKEALENKKPLKGLSLEIKNHLLKNFSKIFTRSFSKSIIMPTFYNMGKRGRDSIIYNSIREHVLEFAEYNKALNTISVLVLDTLLKNYSYTVEYQESLVEICKEYSSVESNISVNLRTLDGSFISYSYLEQLSNFARIYRDGKSYKYRIFIQDENAKRKTTYNQYWSFPPNYIHSIDGAICRIVCRIYYLKWNKHLEPLHDSFRIPLDQIYNLNNTIKYVYFYFFFNKFFNKFKIDLKKEGLVSSEKYLENASKYFPELPENFNFNILKYTFFDQLNTTIENEKRILKMINNIKEGDSFTEEESRLFLESNFLFFF
jgi:hypothetical protein